jgi:predicted nucleic-acid-binding protein
MIGVDTNVLVRLVAPDDPQQNAAARAFFAKRTADDPAYISGVVLAETIWLLRRRFGYSRTAVENLIRGILSSDDFRVEHGDRLLQILEEPEAARSEVADYLIAWSAQMVGCSRTVTFDRRSAKMVPGMELLS